VGGRLREEEKTVGRHSFWDLGFAYFFLNKLYYFPIVMLRSRMRPRDQKLELFRKGESSGSDIVDRQGASLEPSKKKSGVRKPVNPNQVNSVDPISHHLSLSYPPLCLQSIANTPRLTLHSHLRLFSNSYPSQPQPGSTKSTAILEQFT